MKTLLIFAFLGVATGLPLLPAYADFSVSPSRETPPFPYSESADDAAIWLHPDDPALSVIIGTNKAVDDVDLGLHVYDLDGTLLSSVTGVKHNNVEVRYGFPLGGVETDILAVTNRTSDTIDFFKINPVTRSLSSAGSIASGFTDPYGLALWHDLDSDEFYAFISDNDGDGSMRQYRLSAPTGSIQGSLVRSWNVGSLTEGMIVDDFHGSLFVGQEDVGIWRYDAHPTAGTGTADRIAVGQDTNQVKAGDVEGLTLFAVQDANQGYLLASEQGNDSFAILERYDQDGDGNLYEYITRFSIVDDDIDGVSDTDGIDVISTALNSTFRYGLLVAQDGSNDSGGQNYKLVSWSEIASAAAADGLTLATDPDYTPRGTTPPPRDWVLLNAIASGNWNSPNTWDHGTYAPIDVDVVWVSGHTVTVASDGSAGTLDIDGGRVVVNAGRTLEVVGSTGLSLGGGALDIRGTVDTPLVMFADGTLTISPGGTLDVGTFSMNHLAEYVCEIGITGNGLIAVGGNAVLGGELTLKMTAVGDQRGLINRTILTSAGPGGIEGTFREVPPVHVPNEGPAGHIGMGVFHRGIHYVKSGPEETDPITSVTADLFIARGGDSNADGYVDGQDITTLIENYNGNQPKPVADRTWTRGDTIGGLYDRGDGLVDGRDIIDLIVNFGRPDPGASSEAAATAEYDPATGEFTVSVENVMFWTLKSDGHFTGSGMTGLEASLPSGDGRLISANANTVGDGSFTGLLSYHDVELGQLVAPGTDPGRFTLEYITGFGSQRIQGTIAVVPEPGTLAALAAGLLCLIPILRRWRNRNR
ncbi:MAG TPA: phytase [Thermoguttaceae bacterium]|nr:phytase [Thermoguttaceae bacterium]